MNDLELAVRTIENILPEMPTKGLQKWKGILTTALVKIEAELDTVAEHTCTICLFKEFGFRTELPVGWRERGDLVICFQHEDAEVAEAMQKALDADKPEPVNTEKTLDELMAIL
jgi:hypothetical protein